MAVALAPDTEKITVLGIGLTPIKRRVPDEPGHFCLLIVGYIFRGGFYLILPFPEYAHNAFRSPADDQPRPQTT